MNRKILFRGKRIDNGEWVEGYFGKYFDGDEEVICIALPTKETLAGSLCYEVDPATVGQYTGLTDKNGVKIFEGDLITIPGSKRQGLPAPVSWSNFDAWFEIRRRGFNPICFDGEWGVYEIVGNVHDNPELLEGE